MASILSRPQLVKTSFLFRYAREILDKVVYGFMRLGVVYRVAWEQLPMMRHQMETFSALLAICAGNSPASDELPTQRLVTRSFDIFFDLCLNKRLRKQSWGWWFENHSN